MRATIVWAAGVAALAARATLGVPLDRAGRVLVEPDLSIPGHPEVFVVGDAAAFLHQGGKLLPGVAQTAMQGAEHAAKNILRRESGQPMLPFVYRNLGKHGDRRARLRSGRSAHGPASRAPIGWLAWLFLHIFMLIGFRNRVVVLFEWAIAFLTFQRGARLITEQRSEEKT
jgi:NADH dehydrogenase